MSIYRPSHASRFRYILDANPGAKRSRVRLGLNGRITRKESAEHGRVFKAGSSARACQREGSLKKEAFQICSNTVSFYHYLIV